jgi:prophage regulatory protein
MRLEVSYGRADWPGAASYAASGAVACNLVLGTKNEGTAIMRSKGVALEQRADDGGVGLLETKTYMPSSTAPLRLLRFGEVRQRTGLSRSTIWRMERSSGSFPRRIQVSVNVVAWREDEVSRWIASKIQGARNAQSDPILT